MFCEVAAWAEILNLYHFVPPLEISVWGHRTAEGQASAAASDGGSREGQDGAFWCAGGVNMRKRYVNAMSMTVADHVAHWKKKSVFFTCQPILSMIEWHMRHTFVDLFWGLGRPRSLCPSSPLMPLVPSTLKRACLGQSSSSLRASSSPDAGILGRDFNCLTWRQIKHQMNHAKGQCYINV